MNVRTDSCAKEEIVKQRDERERERKKTNRKKARKKGKVIEDESIERIKSCECTLHEVR